LAIVSISVLTRVLLLWGPVALYAGVIFYMSSQPDVALPSVLDERAIHPIEYTVLGILIVRALAGGLPARITLGTALLGIVLTTAYGLTDELHQMFVPGRFADWNDVVADAIGGTLGAAFCWAWGIISPAFRTRERPPRHGL
jgi:VanZ family protein